MFSKFFRAARFWPGTSFEDREYFLSFAPYINWPRFFREAPVLVSDGRSSNAFSGLCYASTYVGYCRADRNAGATCAEPACARSADGKKKSRCSSDIAANWPSFLVWGATSGKANGQWNNL